MRLALEACSLDTPDLGDFLVHIRVASSVLQLLVQDL